MTYSFGRLPPHPEDTHPRLHLGPFLTSALPAPPASVDWYSRVPDWPVFLNQEIGDCTEAMVGHILENTSCYAGNPQVGISDQDVLTAYERVSGYDPADPSTDQGAVLQDVYGDWRKTGVGGHKVTVFAQVDHGNLTQVKQAVEAFGAVGLGIVVTQQMMDAFHAGQPWTGNKGDDLGGHAVPVVGYDARYVYVVSWGRVQPMTWACLVAVTDEAWVAVLPEWFDAAGHDPGGLDLHGLGEAFAQLTGQPNPFPVPAPVPPGPGPVPDPPMVDEMDRLLAAAAHTWVTHPHTGSNRHMASALTSWMQAKGL